MKHKVVAPSVGESITEVSILSWAKNDGDQVSNGEVILEIESDKATVEVIAEADGALEIKRQAGETVSVGETLAEIDDTKEGAKSETKQKDDSDSKSSSSGGLKQVDLPASGGASLSPSVQRVVAENNLDPSKIEGTGKGGRITKGDALSHLESAGGRSQSSARSTSTESSKNESQPKSDHATKDRPGDRRVPMSRLRQKIAERLVSAQHNAAILTTFNEVDMSEAMAVRKKLNPEIINKHGTKLGYMSMFSRACVLALKELPAVNAYIDGTDIIYHDYVDLGIAVGTDRGLVVPVVRGADEKSMIDIEKDIAMLAEKARKGKLSIADMSGGTFTISNGGTYGSMMSTPILNPPQSGILGMHNIVERPMAIDGKVEIRPMMYTALSYDHRIIDGKEAVTFLVKVKEYMENPKELGLEF